ncbi:hypothetical protein Zmor_026897 [Zophobas morio]|uniref:Uncharacterized protein n=1 Tax=Zophobas morio TaxID=2755281 RepID=A0AA38M6D3_9CUCU|nr:hypothetical protein Zmor_026897 [Zophobas morio]
MVYCRSKEGQLIEDTVEKLDRWAEYFEDLLHDKTEEEQQPKVVEKRRQENNEIQQKIEEPTRYEVSRMIQEIKSHKSPGENRISAELLKIGAEQLIKRIYQRNSPT